MLKVLSDQQRSAGKSNSCVCFDEDMTWDLLNDINKFWEHLKTEKRQVGACLLILMIIFVHSNLLSDQHEFYVWLYSIVFWYFVSTTLSIPLTGDYSSVRI